jgi:hypothetical protein
VSPRRSTSPRTGCPEITAVLNGFRRPHTLRRQVEAVRAQTLAPASIMFWQNENHGFDASLTDTLECAASNRNWGVWARFAYALNSRTPYVCVFDDDTIPGRRWFENCVETIEHADGLLGAIGVVFLNGETYTPFTRHGWGAPNEVTRRVDIVGHAWFFRREWLSLFWRELPPIDGCFRVGEDIHFSAMLQRFGAINTYVPPHPADQPELWGSQPAFAHEVGKDAASVSLSPDGMLRMNQALALEIGRGFTTINARAPKPVLCSLDA